jgi:hypothetical protein
LLQTDGVTLMGGEFPMVLGGVNSFGKALHPMQGRTRRRRRLDRPGMKKPDLLLQELRMACLAFAAGRFFRKLEGEPDPQLFVANYDPVIMP